MYSFGLFQNVLVIETHPSAFQVAQDVDALASHSAAHAEVRRRVSWGLFAVSRGKRRASRVISGVF